MRVVTARWIRFALVTLIALALAAGAAQAQGTPPDTPPGVEHYLVYPVLNPPRITFPILTHDQFLNAPFEVFELDFLMTPVNKNNEGMQDSLTHYTWWKLSPQQFGAYTTVTNQFGRDQALQVVNPEYLLNPALKSIAPEPPPTTIPIPFKNHYVAYGAFGNPVNASVTLQDQFYYYAAVVTVPRFLAPPAEKIYQGQVFPIVDPVPHLTVYELNPLPPLPPPPPPVFARDEFGVWQLILGPPRWLCVPSYKGGVVSTKATSWGRLKSLYR